MRQAALTLIARVKDDGLGPLRQVLRDRSVALHKALGSIGTIHYARWVIVEPVGGYPAALVFASDYDGELHAHVAALVGALGPLLDEVYTHCEGYVLADRAAYLLSIRRRDAAVYQGAPGRTVETIAREKSLRERLARAAETGDWKGRTPTEVQAALRQQVLSEPEFAWAKAGLKIPGVNYLGLLVFAAIAILLLPFLVLWAVYIQFFHELLDPPGTITPNDVPDDLIEANVSAEDYSHQNQFSQVMLLKPGRARRFTLALMFFFTRLLIRWYFVKGKLMGIPTIHFARWIVLDDARLVFFSNFDGTWTQYLGDFIDKSGWGLNAIFGNTQRFPRIWFLFGRGAYDEMHFLGWSRATQVPTQVWYAASVDQSIKNVNANTDIRNMLGRDVGELEAQRFLAGL